MLTVTDTCNSSHPKITWKDRSRPSG